MLRGLSFKSLHVSASTRQIRSSSRLQATPDWRFPKIIIIIIAVPQGVYFVLVVLASQIGNIIYRMRTLSTTARERLYDIVGDLELYELKAEVRGPGIGILRSGEVVS